MSLRGAKRRGNLPVRSLFLQYISSDVPRRFPRPVGPRNDMLYRKMSHLCHCEERSDVAIPPPRHCEEGISPTWQSPGTIYRHISQQQTTYREIPTVATLPRNDIQINTSSKALPFGEGGRAPARSGEVRLFRHLLVPRKCHLPQRGRLFYVVAIQILTF